MHATLALIKPIGQAFFHQPHIAMAVRDNECDFLSLQMPILRALCRCGECTRVVGVQARLLRLFASVVRESRESSCCYPASPSFDVRIEVVTVCVGSYMVYWHAFFRIKSIALDLFCCDVATPAKQINNLLMCHSVRILVEHSFCNDYTQLVSSSDRSATCYIDKFSRHCIWVQFNLRKDWKSKRCELAHSGLIILWGVLEKKTNKIYLYMLGCNSFVTWKNPQQRKILATSVLLYGKMYYNNLHIRKSKRS